VEVTGDLAVCPVGRDEGGDGDGGGVCEELGNLDSERVHKLDYTQRISFVEIDEMHYTYLRDSPNVLIPALLVETQVLVQAKAHIVSV